MRISFAFESSADAVAHLATLCCHSRVFVERGGDSRLKLYISRIVQEDAGTYKCAVKPPHGDEIDKDISLLLFGMYFNFNLNILKFCDKERDILLIKGECNLHSTTYTSIVISHHSHRYHYHC